LLKSILNVPWEYEEMVPDYVMGRTTCALFLSLRYHNLNPDYINERLKQLGKQYELRVLLLQVYLAGKIRSTLLLLLHIQVVFIFH
jgi:DNA excision repair protein ERCC-1